MKYPPEEVDICAQDRLRGEEIMGHEGHPTRNVRRYVASSLFDNGLEVLDDEGYGGESAGKGYTDKALRATDLEKSDRA